MRTSSHPLLRWLALPVLTALTMGVPLHARPDWTPGSDGEEVVRYLVYVAPAGDGHPARPSRGLLPLSAETGGPVRIVALVRLCPHQATGAPEGPGLPTGPDLARGVEEWLRRRAQTPPAAVFSTPRLRAGGLALLADGTGRVLGEASPPPWAEMGAEDVPETPPGPVPRISTDINFSTWGKVKELFR